VTFDWLVATDSVEATVRFLLIMFFSLLEDLSLLWMHFMGSSSGAAGRRRKSRRLQLLIIRSILLKGG
jgi:hypothetical protein